MNIKKERMKANAKKNNFILIGSSMGAWIALKQFSYFKSQIKGFVGIGSAPEFLTRLMWNKFPSKTKRELLKKGIILMAILKPFFAPSIKQLYTLIFSIKPRTRKRHIMANKIKLLNKELTVFNVAGSKLLK